MATSVPWRLTPQGLEEKGRTIGNSELTPRRWTNSWLIIHHMHSTTWAPTGSLIPGLCGPSCKSLSAIKTWSLQSAGSTCTTLNKGCEHRLPWELVWETTVVVSIWTNMCYPMSCERQCFISINTALISRHFICDTRWGPTVHEWGCCLRPHPSLWGRHYPVRVIASVEPPAFIIRK